MKRMWVQADAVAVAVLVAVAALFVHRSDSVVLRPEIDVTMRLPDRVGACEAHDVRFCQTETCMRVWPLQDLAGRETCPDCGGTLRDVALSEWRALPRDTEIVRRNYASPLGESFSVAVVVSAREQRSLHRPQQCLPAQGFVIESSRVEEVPLAGSDPLRVMVLDLRRAGRATTRPEAVFAYWYAGQGRETPFYLERLWYNAMSRVLRQEVHRWAYVAVNTQGYARPAQQQERLHAFLAQLHPMLKTGAAP
jgi:EpsI family protein